MMLKATKSMREVSIPILKIARNRFTVKANQIVQYLDELVSVQPCLLATVRRDRIDYSSNWDYSCSAFGDGL
jgi:hypothetical protein